MDDDQQFCLRWNNHQSTLISVFDTLLENGTLVDCTLAAEGKFLKAHKVVLSACSPYFATLLSQQYDKHPIFILKDVKFQELRAMMDYMYRGEVNISQDQLAALLKAAESLQIKGLSDSRGGGNSTNMPSQAHLKGDGKTSSHVPAPKASGLTIENKRPLLRTDFDADVSGSREGSVSPSTRKRKKVNQRRKSLAESNNLLDNHDQHSNSSSHSNNQQQQLSINTSATSAPSNNMSVTNKKTEDAKSNNQEHHESENNGGDDEQVHTLKRTKHDDTDNKQQESELMIEPKNEYDDDEDDDGNVEDLTMDDEMLDDMDQAGPSHGGEGSSQGYHWQMDNRSQDGSMMTQEAAGQHRDAQGDGDTNTINLDKYFYFGDNNSDFTTNNFKIALPTPPTPATATPQHQQSTWVDYTAIQSSLSTASNNGTTQNDLSLDLPPLTEIKQEKIDDDYEAPDVPVWHTAKSTAKITMFPSHQHKTHKIQIKRRFQQIQPKPPPLTPTTAQVMPPLTQIVTPKPAPKLIAVAVKKIIPIQPKPSQQQIPKLTQIQPKADASPPQQQSPSKLVIKKVSHIAMNTRRHSTGNSSKIVPTKELLESLKQENIIYQDNEDKPWYCKTCGRNYKWRNSLKQHIKNECGVPPKYHCARKCGYKTHIHSNLKRHLNSKFCKPGGSKHDDDD